MPNVGSVEATLKSVPERRALHAARGAEIAAGRRFVCRRTSGSTSDYRRLRYCGCACIHRQQQRRFVRGGGLSGGAQRHVFDDEPRDRRRTNDQQQPARGRTVRNALQLHRSRYRGTACELRRHQRRTPGRTDDRKHSLRQHRLAALVRQFLRDAQIRRRRRRRHHER